MSVVTPATACAGAGDSNMDARVRNHAFMTMVIVKVKRRKML
jgi:hypothetical protein